MKTLINIEWLKLKGSRIWLPILVLPLISVIYGSVNYAGNRGVLQHEWLSLWTQVYLFYGAFFFPCLIGIICAYIWYSEHKRQAIKLLLTSAFSFRDIIWAKMLVAFSLVMLSQLYFLSLYVISGLLFRFEMAFPLELLFWALLTSLFSLVLVAIQSYLSLRIASFAPPVALSMLLGIGGFVLSAQAIFPELAYLLASSKLSLAINQMTTPHLELPLADWARLVGYSVLLLVFFVTLQHRFLKKCLR